MTFLSKRQTLAAALLATATFALPAAAQAQNYNSTSRAYENCRQADTENQIIGGIIGAIAGGVAGSQVAGNGARTEGSALGAVLGGAAGAAIAGDSRNCKQEARRGSSSGVYYTSGSSYRTAPSRSYSGSRTYGSTDSSSYGSGHTTRRHNGYVRGQSVDDLKYRIENLRAELRSLETRQRHQYSPRRARQIKAVGEELRVMKKRKRHVKDRIKSSSVRYYR